MAFPWDFEENFEVGTLGSFVAGTDNLGRLDFPGPQDDLDVPPFRGGYVMRVDLNRAVVTATDNDAYVVMDTALDLANAETKYARLMLRISDDTKIPGAADSVRILQLLSGTTTEEAALGLVRSDKGDIMLAVQSPEYLTAVPASGGWIRGIDLPRNMWHCIELTFIASSSGTSEFRVFCNDHQVSAIGMTWANPLTSARLGAITQSLDIRGTLYFDSIVVDSERLVAPQLIDPLALDNETITLTKTGYAFVGPGEVDCVTLIPMTTLDSVHLYDTDRLPVSHHDLKVALKANLVESCESYGKKMFNRGCYAVLAAPPTTTAAPLAIIKLGSITEYSWGA